MAEASKKFCFDFANGRCKRGNKCKFSHEPKPTFKAPHREPCPYLGTSRGCLKGQRCRFSHDAATSENGGGTPQPASNPQTQTKLNVSIREWIFLIPKKHRTFGVLDLAKFFKLGWDLISKGHTDAGQQIIKKLATEEGLAMIKALTEEMVDGLELGMRLRIFNDKMVPFFQTITYPDVLSSLILETPLDTVYQFLFGPNGRRAICLFTFATSALGALSWDEKTEDEEFTSVAVTASLAVLERIVELNQSAQVVTEFTSIVNDLSNSIPEKLLEAGSRSLARVRQRLGLGAAMSISGGYVAAERGHRPAFDLGQDLPGTLSQLGPRHDNDHAAISDIKILLTTEEIQSSRIEYLPSSDPTKHHLPGLAGLLDRQFRLLREDTVGQLRDAVHIEYARLKSSPNAQPPQKRQNNGVRTIIYHEVTLLGLEFDRRRGLQIVAEFDQPAILTRKTAKERETWWVSSKRLQTDTFVCLVSSSGRAIFFSVCDPAPKNPPKKRNSEEVDKLRSTGYWATSGERPSLFKNGSRATLMLSLVEESPEDMTWINSHLGTARKQRQSLVEFPGILLPSFGPTLQALQKMSRTLDLPFSQFIAPDIKHAQRLDVPAPAYSRRRGFNFNLETLTNGERLSLTPGQPFDETTLRNTSSLDHAQQVSTINALRSCLALIQGPPGTGKSYTGVAIIKTLLKNRDAAKLGPIICVCYTNHALDQLLEHLVGDGVKQLIRLGSRSKSTILQDLNLQHVSQLIQQTKIEGYENYQLHAKMDEVLDEVEELLPCFQDPAHWSSIKDYLEEHHNDHFLQFFGRTVDEQGFREVRGKNYHVLSGWIKGAPKRLISTRPVSELLNVRLQEMSGSERSALHQYWVQQNMIELNRRFLGVVDSYREVRESQKKCHKEKDLRCLLSAHIIGVTTTGLARNLDILRRVQAKVVMFEEAGEVLEAHTLTALLPSVEHAILIGDHEQLRPQINNYEFQHDNPRGVDYSLDISLFERLIHPQSGYPKLPYSSLEIQRRMHPSIAELVRSTLYPKLQDHSTVSNHPEVDGMRKRLFWLDHNEKEDNSSSDPAQSVSKTNAWEVEMTAALVSHLVRQGTYQNQDIAVITPYLGQLQKLKQRLRSSFAIVVGDRDLEELETQGLEDNSEEEADAPRSKIQKTTLLNALRVATVDNFQGEEAKVIVISLVRSNNERRCGFLKTSNRINVLLSRARHGMYIIGNINTARPVAMWDKVITILEKEGNVGQTLALCCPRHKETPIEVSKPDDFSVYSPEGGCNQKCILRLDCGHACINKCHSEPLHSAVRCLERCQRIKKGCDHACPKKCGDLCDPKCQIQVPDITLPCGHVQARLPCHLAQAPATVSCNFLMETSMPGCKHIVKQIIHAMQHAASRSSAGTTANIDAKIVIPEVKMAASWTPITAPVRLDVVGSTPLAVMHAPRPATGTGHVGSAWKHVKFGVVIRDVAKGAMNLVFLAWKSAPGPVHIEERCPSLCGEACPEVRYCQDCAAKDVKDKMVDYIMGSTYAEIDLDENPCIIPSCGHILSLESMDGHMEIAKHYVVSDDTDAEQPIIALRSSSVPFSASDLKNCPMCRAPLRNINRYGRIVRRAWIDEATKKFIIWANSQFVPLASRLGQAETRLAEPVPENQVTDLQLSSALDRLSLEPIRLTGSRDEQIKFVTKAVKSDTRYREILLLRKAIKKHLEEVDEAEQPIGRIHDLVEDARKNAGVTAEITDIPSVLQVRNRLLATVLLLRCDYDILFDFITHSAGTASGKNPRDIRLNLTLARTDCEKLVEESQTRQQPTHAVEGLLYWSRFVSLERNRSANLSEADMTNLVNHAQHYQLHLARLLCKTSPAQTAGMPAEIDEVEKQLRSATFYAPVTNVEKAAVYAAMAQSFSGTGHWYYCVNGHPFTVGECGMPMQTSRCPQCGATVGGTHHQSVAGVTRAADLEAEFGR